MTHFTILVGLSLLASLAVAGGASAGPCGRVAIGDVVSCALCIASGADGCALCPPGAGDLCPPPPEGP